MRKFTAFSVTALFILQHLLIISPATANAAAAVSPLQPSVPVAAAPFALPANGSITALGTAMTENFDTLASTGTTAIAWTNNSTIPAWYIASNVTTTTYSVGTGSSNTGAFYSFGAGLTNPITERALGSVSSGTPQTMYSGTRLVNNTGSTITSLDLSYVGEQWRHGGPATPVAQKLDFQYQVTAAGALTNVNGAGTWTDYDVLDFSSPTFAGTVSSALDGNAAANRTALSSTLSVTILPGQEIWLRWVDINDASNDHGLAVDDFSVTANGGGGGTSTNPTGVGLATPNSVPADGATNTLLTVTVTPGTNPASTGLAVSANLSSIGGSATQAFFDNGTNGDATAGDNIFSFQTTVQSGTTGGAKTLAASITDGQARTGSANISLTVQAPTNPSGTGAANPSPVAPGASSLLTVTVTPGTIPASTGITVTGDLSSIGGSATQAFFNDGSNGDATTGDNIHSFSLAVGSSVTPGLYTFPVEVRDAQNRTGTASISLSVSSSTTTPAGAVVISQVYGGGGNAGATLRNDYIEIFNRSLNPVDLTGWSVQYGSSTQTTWTATNLPSVVLQPGQYFLIQQAAGTGGTVDLPTPDAIGTLALGGTAGKIALSRTTTVFSGACPAAADLMDLVGYGAANCSEGTAAPALTNTTAAIRVSNGCKDTDANSLNFLAGPPAPRNRSTALNVCTNPNAPAVISTVPANAASNVSVNSDITVGFDDSVTVQNGAFTISCTTSGAHTSVVSGSGATYTLNPDVDFASDETCTVTVVAANVISLTTSQPMAANYTWSFTTFVIRSTNEHMVMGNPSGAVTDVNFPLNYLMLKPQYALSYNNDRGIPNWTQWHLDSTWTTGVADRQNDFRSDPDLPAGFKTITSGYNFATYAFDRGHMTPSADRTSSIADNSATFLMTNMIPQASGNNQGPWANLENDARALLGAGTTEIYIVSGGYGTGGVSATGPWSSILDTGNNLVVVPQLTWKVFLVMPRADGDDVARVTTSTRTFAVIMPNNDGIRADDWKKYLATVDQVEALTGYDFFSNVPTNIQAVIEARLDSTLNTAPVATPVTVNAASGGQKIIDLAGTDFNVNNVLTYSVATQPQHGTVTINNSVAGLAAAPAAPQAIYTANAGYTGPDSFTFTATDGAATSAPATVTVNVLVPTAAGVTVGGRVLNADGTPASKAIVRLTESNGTTRVARTDRNGAYRFEDVAAGQVVTVGVKTREASYGTKVLQLADSIGDLDFSPNR